MQKKSFEEKIKVFRSLFTGSLSAYGTYNPDNGKYYQIKQKVARNTIYNHLKGIQPYGFYPLTGDHTSVGIVDFDDQNPFPAIQFIQRAWHYDMPSYLEISKSKGYHVWIFVDPNGVPAKIVRTVLNFIIDEIGFPDTEIFPKQNQIKNGSYGNFINAPLFGKLVQQGKSIFVESNASLLPYPNQWDFLKSVKRVTQESLESIIEINGLNIFNEDKTKNEINRKAYIVPNFGLPICIRRMLIEGVTFDQRVACFRISLQLKKIGLPKDIIEIILFEWSKKNKPKKFKRNITKSEINSQIEWAFGKDYLGIGCEEPVIKKFCEPHCLCKLKKK